MGYAETDGTERLENPDNLLNIIHKPLHNGGRREGDENLPQWLRVMVGTAANMGTTKQAAEAFGVSHSQAHQLKHGRTGPERKKEDLTTEVNKNLEIARRSAVMNLMDALNMLPSRVNEKTTAKDLASIAKDMASVAERTAPIDQRHSGLNVVFNMPRQKDEKDYEIIDVQAVVEDDE